MANYSQQVNIKTSKEKAFLALNQFIGQWWGHVDNAVNKVDDQFTITFGEAYWTFKIVEFVENEKVTWEVVDGQPELNNEWIEHKLLWQINEDLPNSVCVRLVQEGLTQDLPCYDICSSAWDRFILISLKQFLETGEGEPGS